MLPEVYVSVFAGHMCTNSKAMKNQAKRTLSGQLYSISEARLKIYCSPKYPRRIGQSDCMTRPVTKDKELNKKLGAQSRQLNRLPAALYRWQAV